MQPFTIPLKTNDCIIALKNNTLLSHTNNDVKFYCCFKHIYSVSLQSYKGTRKIKRCPILFAVFWQTGTVVALWVVSEGQEINDLQSAYTYLIGGLH